MITDHNFRTWEHFFGLESIEISSNLDGFTFTYVSRIQPQIDRLGNVTITFKNELPARRPNRHSNPSRYHRRTRR